jgi:hypothetical protein
MVAASVVFGRYFTATLRSAACAETLTSRAPAAPRGGVGWAERRAIEASLAGYAGCGDERFHPRDD